MLPGFVDYGFFYISAAEYSHFIVMYCIILSFFTLCSTKFVFLLRSHAFSFWTICLVHHLSKWVLNWKVSNSKWWKLSTSSQKTHHVLNWRVTVQIYSDRKKNSQMCVSTHEQVSTSTSAWQQNSYRSLIVTLWW